MALPTSRNTTYSALAQVKSADLNDLQDWIINHEGRIVAVEDSATDHETRIAALEDPPTWISLHLARTESGNWSISSAGKWTAVSSGTVQVPLPTRQGRTITQVRMVYLRGGGTVTLRVFSVDDSGANTEEATFSDNSTSTEQTHDFALSLATDDKTFYCLIQTDGSGSGTELRAVRLT